jgi:transcriptional regulator with XRE-family HTH domain
MTYEILKPSELFGHGKRLIMVRDQFELSQKHLAEDLGLFFGYLSHMEN